MSSRLWGRGYCRMDGYRDASRVLRLLDSGQGQPSNDRRGEGAAPNAAGTR
jgi:hypothetical protein